MSWSALQEITGHVDTEIREDVLAFHAKTTWTLGGRHAIPRPWRLKISELPKETVNTTAFGDHPLSQLPGAMTPLPAPNINPPKRLRSATNFCPNAKINAQEIGTLLGSSFQASADGRRPYPSAGALYPTGAIFIGFRSRVIDPTYVGAFHYRASRHLMERIVAAPESDIHHALFGDRERHAAATCALVYFFHLDVCLFKYRSRGYRHALLEIGAMGQQVDFVAKEMGLATCLWSGFSDMELSRAIGLNPSVTPIAIVHLIGKERVTEVGKP